MKRFDFQEKAQYLFSTKGSRYIFGVFILIIAMVVLINMRMATAYQIDFNETQIHITGPDGTDPITVDYRSVLSVSLLEQYTSGSMVSGISKSRLQYGTYRNESYGEYSLCVVPSIPVAIEVRTGTGVLVFNYETKDVTAALAQNLTEFVAKKQQ